VLSDQTGTITVTPVAVPQTNVDDVPLAAGTACVVTIQEAPQPPVANAGTDTTVQEGGTVGLDGSMSQDRAGESNLTFSWAIQGGGPGSLTNATTATPTYNAPANVDADTPVTIRLTVTDPDQGPAATDDVVVTVQDTSALAPVANAGADTTVTETGSVGLDGSASVDNDGADNLTFAWAIQGGAGGSLMNADTATPTYTAPSVSSDQPVTIRLTVTDPDNGFNDTDDVVVTVLNLSIGANAGPDRTVAEGAAAITLNGSGNDGALPAGNITFQWSIVSGPGALSNATAEDATFTPAADVNCTQQTIVQLVVTDPDLPGGSNTASDQAVVTTTDTNDSCPDDAPVANAGPDRTVNEGGAVALDGSASVDNEGADNITFSWAKATAGDPGTISNATAETATFNAPGVDGDRSVIVNLTVTDPDVSIGGNTDSDMATVTIVDTDCSGKQALQVTTRPPNATPLEVDGDAITEGDRFIVHGARHNNTCATGTRTVSRLVYNIVGLDEDEEIPDFDGFSFFLTLDEDGDGARDAGETTVDDACELIGSQIVCDLSLIDGAGEGPTGGLGIAPGSFEDVLLGVLAEEDAPVMAGMGVLALALAGGAAMFLFSLVAPGRARKLVRGGMAAVLVLITVGAGLSACHGTRGPRANIVTTITRTFRADLVTVDVNGPADTGLPIPGRTIEVTFTPDALI
ncbi:MAG: hypothetical protein K8I02_11520, partial [Candidatus Methylomirabilis sp.]|nr:hypothetical protein [Deltaproteobacteria bacterium]